MTKIEYVVIAIIIVILIVVGIAGSDERNKFMSDCIKDKKQYECEVLYKQMHPDPQTMILIH